MMSVLQAGVKSCSIIFIEQIGRVPFKIKTEFDKQCFIKKNQERMSERRWRKTKAEGKARGLPVRSEDLNRQLCIAENPRDCTYNIIWTYIYFALAQTAVFSSQPQKLQKKQGLCGLFQFINSASVSQAIRSMHVDEIFWHVAHPSSVSWSFLWN